MSTEVLYGKKKADGPRVSPERREWVRKESMMIYSRNLVHRDKVSPYIVCKAHEGADATTL